jgi:hypothetical protein
MSFSTAILALEPLHIDVIAATAGVARMIGLMTVKPVFLRLGMTGLLRGVAALVLALPAMPMIAAAMQGSHPSLALWGGLMIKEVMVGLVVGMVLGVPIWSRPCQVRKSRFPNIESWIRFRLADASKRKLMAGIIGRRRCVTFNRDDAQGRGLDRGRADAMRACAAKGGVALVSDQLDMDRPAMLDGA